jgi:hypothetical protein
VDGRRVMTLDQLLALIQVGLLVAMPLLALAFVVVLLRRPEQPGRSETGDKDHERQNDHRRAHHRTGRRFYVMLGFHRLGPSAATDTAPRRPRSILTTARTAITSERVEARLDVLGSDRRQAANRPRSRGDEQSTASASRSEAGYPTLKIFTTNILPPRTGRMIDFGDRTAPGDRPRAGPSDRRRRPNTNRAPMPRGAALSWFGFSLRSQCPSRNSAEYSRSRSRLRPKSP